MAVDSLLLTIVKGILLSCYLVTFCVLSKKRAADCLLPHPVKEISYSHDPGAG
jgi:hypothetical protein